MNCSTNSKQIMVQRKITIDIPNDFLILCELAGFPPEHAIQYFIDNVSFPKLLSCYPIDPNRAVTGLLYIHAKRNVTRRLWGMMYFRFAKEYLEEFENIMINVNDIEQPELEVYAREKLIKYRELYRDCVARYKSLGGKVNESQYES